MRKHYLSKKMKDDVKIQEEKQKYSIYCEKCGWKNHIYKINKGRIICKNCGFWIYENDEVKFKYKMKEVMNKCKYSN